MKRHEQALAEAIRNQREWIRTHGGSRQGYIAMYGSKNDPEEMRSGDGGEAIYAADISYLEQLSFAASVLGMQV